MRKFLASIPFCLYIVLQGFSQTSSLPYIRSLSGSFSHREYSIISQRKINANYYFFEKKYFQTGAFFQFSWFPENTYEMNISTRIISIGIPTNIYIFPLCGFEQNRFKIYIPFNLGINMWTNSFEITDFNGTYEYGIGAHFHCTQHLALFGHITNDSFSYRYLFITGGLSYIWNKK